MPKPVLKVVRNVDESKIDADALRLMAIMLEKMLGDPDKVTLTEMTRGLAAVTRARYVQVMTGLKTKTEDENVGSSVRKYTQSFQANATRGRKAGGGSRSLPASVTQPERDELGIFDDDDESA